MIQHTRQVLAPKSLILIPNVNKSPIMRCTRLLWRTLMIKFVNSFNFLAIDHSYNWHISVVECVNHLESELRTRLDSVLLFHLYYSVQFCVYTWRISTKLGRNVCLTNDYLSINFLLVPCFDLWFLASFWFHKKNAITQIQ